MHRSRVEGGQSSFCPLPNVCYISHRRQSLQIKGTNTLNVTNKGADYIKFINILSKEPIRLRCQMNRCDRFTKYTDGIFSLLHVLFYQRSR